MNIKEKIRHIKYSRLSPQDKLLTEIFSNLDKVETDMASYYIYNDIIYLKKSKKYNTMLYAEHNIHNLLDEMKIPMKDILDLIEKYIKIYLNIENTLPWKSNEYSWLYEINKLKQNERN